jgi:hypothetical protein
MKISVVIYEEPGEEYIYGVLAPSINEEEFLNKLNNGIEAYNADVDLLIQHKDLLRTKYRLNAPVEEITGMSLIGREQYPKFPATIPKGMGKTIQQAYPDIYAERQRIEAHNELFWTKHQEFVSAANIEIEKELKPLRDELVYKYPLYAAFARSEENIYYKFKLEEKNYITFAEAH